MTKISKLKLWGLWLSSFFTSKEIKTGNVYVGDTIINEPIEELKESAMQAAASDQVVALAPQASFPQTSSEQGEVTGQPVRKPGAAVYQTREKELWMDRSRKRGKVTTYVLVDVETNQTIEVGQKTLDFLFKLK